MERNQQSNSALDAIVQAATGILLNRTVKRKNKKEAKWGKNSKHSGTKKTGKSGGSKLDRKLKATRKLAAKNRKRCWNN